MKKRPLVVVEWDDVISWDSWKMEEDVIAEERPVHAVMVGWQIAKTRKHLILATARTEDGDCRGRRIIPKGCIRSIRRLE